MSYCLHWSRCCKTCLDNRARVTAGSQGATSDLKMKRSSEIGLCHSTKHSVARLTSFRSLFTVRLQQPLESVVKKPPEIKRLAINRIVCAAEPDAWLRYHKRYNSAGTSRPESGIRISLSCA